MRLRYVAGLIIFFILCNSNISYAGMPNCDGSNVNLPECISDPPAETPVEERAIKENSLLPYYFAITFYKPTYVLPLYYTGSPYHSVYQGNTPNNEGLKNTEVKYQLSFKVPIWKNFLNKPSTLYLAYTQLSYWQAYNRLSFFRETDYEPELFLANEINIPMLCDWKLNFFNIGAIHQSNGFGNSLERTWNRIYLEFILSSNGNWMVSIKPWVIFHDESMRQHNPNIANYMGYGQILVAYKFNKQVLTLQLRNVIESGGKRSTGEFTWSFPITAYLNGYLQLFSGYGQSLIEYNHHTNSAGLGITLNNWI